MLVVIVVGPELQIPPEQTAPAGIELLILAPGKDPAGISAVKVIKQVLGLGTAPAGILNTKFGATIPLATVLLTKVQPAPLILGAGLASAITPLCKLSVKVVLLRAAPVKLST